MQNNMRRSQAGRDTAGLDGTQDTYYGAKSIAVEDNLRQPFNDLRHLKPKPSMAIKKLKTRRKVGLIIESSRSYGRNLLRGVALYSRTRSNWSLLHEEMTIDSTLPDWLNSSGISGMIARVDEHNIAPLRGLGVPIVDVRCRHKYSGIPQVETDDQRVAELAFEHLHQRGFRQFAFCGYRGAHYSEIRLRHFQNLTTNAGCSLSVYETAGHDSQPVTSIERAGVLEVESMAQWLKHLAAPTGLFVCNDIRGQQVLNVCRTLNLSVPDDIAVIGVDDDDAICPLSDPPLSSVRPNAEQIGYQAAELLDAIMNGKTVGETTQYVAPTGVVQRLSTQVIAVEDRELARVCRFIREHACQGIDVGDVVEFTTLSRRQLERRFRTELGRTPHEELTAVQVARVKQLLDETSMTLEEITPLAGYSHKERLSAVFKRETGETPGEYRRRKAPAWQ
ncbi:substrate-binding domain-containing protein [Novipirellula sp. SH528]|uniref:AraC family transcriptional regulator n=1 Tax=Novipirellula sp. SH528 TaxID=3454466 RepID=UPI003FA0F15F